MINNNNIQSGADIEILLGASYIENIIKTFFESKSIPDQISLGSNGVKIHPIQSLQILDGNNQDVELNIPLDFLDNNGTTLLSGRSNFVTKLNFNRISNDAGNIAELKLKLEIIDYTGNIANAIELANALTNANANLSDEDKAKRIWTKPKVLEELNKTLGQEYPLNIFGKGKQIRNMEIKKFADDNQAEKAIGIYINLRLQQGPEDFNVFENTINVSEAINFLPEGQAISFGMNEDMFNRLASDIKQSFAEERNKGEGDWHYPLKDGDKTKGKFRSLKITPYKTPIFNGMNFTGEFEMHNALLITLKGEIDVKEADIKPDFTVKIALKPNINNGNLEWETELIDSDVDLTFWETLKLGFAFGFIIGWVLAIFTGPIGLAVGGVLGGISMLFIDPIADAIGEGIISDLYKQYIDTSLFDAIPDRVTTITRRRDPFYLTDFQVVSNISELSINDEGFSLAATASTGTQFIPVDHVVIKNEIRNSQNDIIGFEIRVKDWQKIDADVLPNFTRKNSSINPALFYLSVDEVRSRKSSGDRYRQKLQFNWPFKIDKENNSISRIKTISTVEKIEIENKYLLPHLNERGEWFDANLKDSTMQEVVTALEKKLGRPLNDNDDKEKQRRYNEKFKEWIEEEELTYRRGPLKPLFKADAEQITTFDLSPNEFGKMQQKGLMAMVYTYKRIHLKKTNTFYYRTEKNHSLSDNLGNFPEYESWDSNA